MIRPAAERREIDLTFSADDAELIAIHTRVPSHVDDAARAAFVINENGCGILDLGLVDRVRDESGGACGIAEQEVDGVDAVTRDVIKRSSSCLSWIEEPSAVAAGSQPWQFASARMGVPISPAAMRVFASSSLGKSRR